MSEVLSVVAVIGGFVVTMAVLASLATRIRRRGGGAGLMDPVDEIFNPSAHRLRQETAIYEQRMLPVAPAEDLRRPLRSRRPRQSS
jgi:hypothetical protein